MTSNMQKQDERIRSNMLSLNSQKDWLDRIPNDFSSMLDVGCGVGYHSKYFSDLGHKVTSLDYDLSSFEFSDEIKHVEGSFLDYEPTEKFDAILCSHVLEHFPDTRRVFMKARDLLKVGGYLFVVVPKYTPYSCNGHWSTGWNITQLAGWLVSCGFDCRTSTFSELGLNICGFGRKSDEVEFSYYEWAVKSIVNWLPNTAKKIHQFIAADELMRADVTWIDPTKVAMAVSSAEAAFPSFPVDLFVNAGKKTFYENWNDQLAVLDPTVDLSDKTTTIVALVEGEPVGMRLIVGSNSQGGSFDAHADLWRDYPMGVTLVKIPHSAFTPRGGVVDWTRIDQIGLGGPKRVGATVRFAVIAECGQILLTT